MMRLFVTTGGVLLAALLVSCGGSSATPSLDGTSWKLTQVGGSAAQPGGMLGFAAEKLTGSTGCNSFGGGYTQSGDALTIDLGALHHDGVRTASRPAGTGRVRRASRRRGRSPSRTAR